MKNLILFFFVFLLNSMLYAQVPSGFKYQAVARDAQGKILKNKDIAIKCSLLTHGSTNPTNEYTEAHEAKTSEIGVFSFQIGDGKTLGGSFLNFDWSSEPDVWINIDMDVTGTGNNYRNMGSFPLLTVPYAKFAESVMYVDDADADPNNEIQQLSIKGSKLTISGGNTVNLPTGGGGGGSNDDDPNNEIQDISSIKNGNQVNISMSLGGKGTTIDVSDFDSDVSNELQTLNYDVNTKKLSLSQANEIDLSGLGGSQWRPTINGIGYDKSVTLGDTDPIIYGLQVSNDGNVILSHSSNPQNEASLQVQSGVERSRIFSMNMVGDFSFNNYSDGTLRSKSAEIASGTGADRMVINSGNGPIHFMSNGNTRMFVDTDNEIGFGTSNPAAKHHFEGDVLVNTGQGYFQLGIPYENQFGFSTNQGGEILTLGTSTNGVQFDQKFSWNNNGNMGIGTANPQYPLDVNGTVHVESDDEEPAFEVNVTFQGEQDVIAVKAQSNPEPGYGIGGKFSGGYRGVEGYGEGENSNQNIIGVYGNATGGDVAYGLYGTASQGSEDNWAGYFSEGDVHVDNNLQVFGDIEVLGKIITPKKISYYSIGATDFMISNEKIIVKEILIDNYCNYNDDRIDRKEYKDTKYQIKDGEGFHMLPSDGGYTEAMAPIHLPHNSTLDKFTGVAASEGFEGEICVAIYKVDFATGNRVRIAANSFGTGIELGKNYLSIDINGINEIIDNLKYSYYVAFAAHLNSEEWNIRGAVLEYSE